jgi:hypothetical protein
MKKLSITLVFTLCLPACADVLLDDQETEPAQPDDRVVSFKADDATTTQDVCERYSLYDDGICDETCSERDPDCDRGAPTASGLEFLCEFEVNGPNGLCIPICGDLDPDCADRELNSEPRCPDSYEDGDYQCNADCFPQDEDCLAEDDTCYDENRYADGPCDADCAFADPDCSDVQPDLSQLQGWQRETCEDLVEFGGSLVEIAYSICIESTPSQLPECAAACLFLYRR